MDRVRLFVYGSLKRDGRHHDELRGATFLGVAKSAPGYAVEPLGQYLALVPTPGKTGSVSGELFELTSDLLPALDEFEGPGYCRGELALDPAESADFSLALAYFKKAR